MPKSPVLYRDVGVLQRDARLAGADGAGAELALHPPGHILDRAVRREPARLIEPVRPDAIAVGFARLDVAGPAHARRGGGGGAGAGAGVWARIGAARAPSSEAARVCARASMESAMENKGLLRADNGQHGLRHDRLASIIGIDMALLSAEQAAAHLHLNVKRVQALARAGKLPGRRVGRKWLFDERDLETALGQHRGRRGRSRPERAQPAPRPDPRARRWTA